MSNSLRLIFLSTLFLLMVSQNALYAQELSEDLLFSERKLKLKDVIQKIEEQTGFRFAFRSDLLDTEKIVSFNNGNISVSECLKVILPKNLDFRRVGRHLVIRPKPGFSKASATGDIIERNPGSIKPVAVSSKSLKKVRIKGQVFSEEGKPLPKASVLALGQNISTLTDSSGHFTLELRTNRKFEGLICRKIYFEDTLLSPPLARGVLKIQLQQEKDTFSYLSPLHANFKRIEETEIAEWVLSPEAFRTAQNLPYIAEKRAIQVSLLPRVGTALNSSGLIRNNASLNILAGYSEGVNGCEIGGLLNINRRDVRGLQLSGFGNMAGGDLNGVQLSGFYNLIRGNTQGLQVAGFMNHCDTLRGVQTTGAVNSSKTVRGLQISGFLNKANENRGIQIGIVNFSRKSSGVAVGLLNLSSSGFKEISLTAHSFLGLEASFRMGDEHFYNIYRISASPELLGWGLGFGSRGIIKKWDFGSELISHMLWTSEVSAPSSWHSVSFPVGLRLKKMRFSTAPFVGLWQSENTLPIIKPSDDMVFGSASTLRDTSTQKHFFRWSYGLQFTFSKMW